MSINTFRSLTNSTLASITPTVKVSTNTSPVSEITAAEHVNFLKGLLNRHQNSASTSSLPDTPNTASKPFSVRPKVQAPVNINRQAEEGLAAIQQDAQEGDKWNAKSIETWKRLFDEAMAQPNATESSVFIQMKALATLINEMTETERVAVAICKEGNVASYYMTLAKDKATTASNNLSIAAGRERLTAIRLGRFGWKM